MLCYESLSEIFRLRSAFFCTDWCCFGVVSDIIVDTAELPLALGMEPSAKGRTYLSLSADFDCVFFRFGAGILHSMEKATQFVQGTPRLAASQRTYYGRLGQQGEAPTTPSQRVADVPFVHGKSVKALSSMSAISTHDIFGHPRQAHDSPR